MKIALTFLALATVSLAASPRASTNYQIPAEGMTSGGGYSSSASYSQTVSFGQIIGTNAAISPSIGNVVGLAGQLAPLSSSLPVPLSNGDDFNDNVVNTAKWAASDVTSGNGSLTEANARLEYRVTTPDPSYDEAIRPWILNSARNTDAFDVVLDVFNNQTPAGFSNASIGLTVTSLENADDSIYVELYRSGPSADGNGFLAALSSAAAGGDEVLPYTTPTNHPAVTSGSVRLSYDPVLQIFTAWYDTTGSSDGFQWQVYGSFGVGALGGGSTRNSPWQLTQNAGFQVSVSGFSEGLTVTSGQVYADNFQTGTGLSGWRLSTFGSAAASGPTEDLADPDGDGVVNLLEFATGQSPASSNTLSTQVQPAAGATLEFYYPRSITALNAGTSFFVEWNDTLTSGTWSSSGVSQQVISSNGTTQQVRATLPAGTGGRRFVRLRVTPPST